MACDNKLTHKVHLCELREYKSNEYVTIAAESQFKQLRSTQKKVFLGLQQDSNLWLRLRCSALPAELRRQTHWHDTFFVGKCSVTCHRTLNGEKQTMCLSAHRRHQGKGFFPLENISMQKRFTWNYNLI